MSRYRCPECQAMCGTDYCIKCRIKLSSNHIVDVERESRYDAPKVDLPPSNVSRQHASVSISLETVMALLRVLMIVIIAGGVLLGFANCYEITSYWTMEGEFKFNFINFFKPVVISAVISLLIGAIIGIIDLIKQTMMYTFAAKVALEEILSVLRNRR